MSAGGNSAHNMSPDQPLHLRITDRSLLKKLSEHIFQGNPAALQKVACHFAESKPISYPVLVPDAPRDYTFHHIAQ